MNNTVGIHDLAFTSPSLFLPINKLADARGIEADKLKYGLGLENMAVCDVDEDVVSLAAQAVLKLLKQNPDIKPQEIGRIYVGTESSIDGSKPIGSYIHGLVNEHYSSTENVLVHADVIDMTFACIGAVDAMHNSLYYLMSESDKYAIVVAADIANYELGSTGEYTQGAGAVAILLGTNPKLLSLSTQWGVGMKSEHDFFKPIRLESQDGKIVELHDEKPIFDGQFSNQTYEKRIVEAWHHFSADKSLQDYQRLIFHLPYAYHGRRIITSLLIADLEKRGRLDEICEKYELDREDAMFTKAFSKTPFYKDWVKTTISPGEYLSSNTGNVYTASIFLSLMSTIMHQGEYNAESYLFFAYGSGSKAKVFEGNLAPSFKEVVKNWDCAEVLEKRVEIDFDQYIDLRTDKIETPLAEDKKVSQVASGILDTNRYERTYKWK